MPTTAAHIMSLVLPYAPEAVLTEQPDGNVNITLNLRLVDNDLLIPFDDESGEDA